MPLWCLWLLFKTVRSICHTWRLAEIKYQLIYVFCLLLLRSLETSAFRGVAFKRQRNSTWKSNVPVSTVNTSNMLKLKKTMSSAFTSTVTCRDQSLYTAYKFSQLHKWNCKYLILTAALNRICKAASQLKCRAMRAQPSITGCICACAAVPGTGTAPRWALLAKGWALSAEDGSWFGYPDMFQQQCQW